MFYLTYSCFVLRFVCHRQFCLKVFLTSSRNFPSAWYLLIKDYLAPGCRCIIPLFPKFVNRSLKFQKKSREKKQVYTWLYTMNLENFLIFPTCGLKNKKWRWEAKTTTFTLNICTACKSTNFPQNSPSAYSDFSRFFRNFLKCRI
jgi:hypothetical protein